MHILFVTIKMKPEHREEYMAEMLLNAKGAQQDEPGCLRFDVVVDSEDANTIHLYEVYKDEAAFGEHQASAHFKRMQSATGDWRDGPAAVQAALQEALQGAVEAFATAYVEANAAPADTSGVR